MPLGAYISVPFCPTKCSYCNFASGVFSRESFARYVERVGADFARAPQVAERFDCLFERRVDSVYLGGGTPTVLDPADLERLFSRLRESFEVAAGAEVTVECAPGTLSGKMLETLTGCGVNRVSLGVQSLVDREAAAVGRRHTEQVVVDDIRRLRAAGIANINLDLIAGLPHQTADSWAYSLAEAVNTGVPHISVYMLEVDEDSRLGREVIAGGRRYHAHFVPREDLVADFYLRACEALESAGVAQYEISNFARPGAESAHNLKYWTRQPYCGFGLDAHSMLPANEEYRTSGLDAVRFFTPSSFDEFYEDDEPATEYISETSALEETFFLGLRLNRGVNLGEVAARFGKEAVVELDDKIFDLLDAGLVRLESGVLKLTSRGRLLSNEVFEKFVSIGKLEDLPDMLGLDPDDPRRARIINPPKIQ